jgi:flagellar biosynthesis GTPase FlhF
MYSGGYDDDDLTAAPITNGAKKTSWGGSNALANGDDDLAGDMEVWRPQEAKTQRKEVSFMIDDTLIEKKKPKVSLLANSKLNTEDIFTKDTEEDDLGPPTPPPEPEEPVEKQVVKNEEEERRKEKEQKKKEEKKREQKEREAREREIKKLRQMCEKLMDRLKDSTAKVTDLRHKNEDKEKKMEQLQKHLLLERQRANRKINNNDGFTLQLSDDTGVKKLTDDSDLVVCFQCKTNI